MSCNPLKNFLQGRRSREASKSKSSESLKSLERSESPEPNKTSQPATSASKASQSATAATTASGSNTEPRVYTKTLSNKTDNAEALQAVQNANKGFQGTAAKQELKAPPNLAEPPKKVLTKEEQEAAFKEEIMLEVKEEIKQEKLREKERRQREIAAADKRLANQFGVGKSTAISFTGDVHHIFNPEKAGEEPLPEEDDNSTVDIDDLHRQWGLEETVAVDEAALMASIPKVTPMQGARYSLAAIQGDSVDARPKQRTLQVPETNRPPAYVAARQAQLRDQGIQSKVNPVAPPKRNKQEFNSPIAGSGPSLVLSAGNRNVMVGNTSPKGSGYRGQHGRNQYDEAGAAVSAPPRRAGSGYGGSQY